MSRRILVVDDEPDILAMLRAVLTGAGYEVRTAASGMEALVAAGSDPPDLVLLDVMMQGMDGWETLKLLRLEPPGREVPVIMISARVEPKDKIRGLQEGAVDYLTKPFAVRDVLARIRAVLGPPA